MENALEEIDLDDGDILYNEIVRIIGKDKITTLLAAREEYPDSDADLQRAISTLWASR